MMVNCRLYAAEWTHWHNRHRRWHWRSLRSTHQVACWLLRVEWTSRWTCVPTLCASTTRSCMSMLTQCSRDYYCCPSLPGMSPYCNSNISILHSNGCSEICALASQCRPATAQITHYECFIESNIMCVWTVCLSGLICCVVRWVKFMKFRSMQQKGYLHVIIAC